MDYIMNNQLCEVDSEWKFTNPYKKKFKKIKWRKMT